MTKILRLQASLVLTLVAALPGYAQWTKTMGQRGFTPGAPFDIKGLDSVNMVNGNLNLTIPITSMAPGKGANGVDVVLSYNSAHWDQDAPLGGQLTNGDFYTIDRLKFNKPWHLVYGAWGLEVEERGWATCQKTTQGSATNPGELYPENGVYQFRSRLIAPDGSQHVLYPLNNINYPWLAEDPAKEGWFTYDVAGRPSACVSMSTATGLTLNSAWGTGNLTWATKDGTYLRLVTLGGLPPSIPPDVSRPTGTLWEDLGWILYMPDGRIVNGTGREADSIVDRNGNTISFSKTTSCFAPIGTNVITIKDATSDTPGADKRCIQIENVGSVQRIRQQLSATEFRNWDITWGGISRPQNEVTANFNYNCKNIDNNSGSPTFGTLIDSTCGVSASYDYGLVTRLDVPGLNCSSACSSYTFSYGPQFNSSERSGALTDIGLPTGASIHYTYRHNGFAPDDLQGHASVNQFSVAQRRVDYQDPVQGPQSETSNYIIQPGTAWLPCHSVSTTGRGTATSCFYDPTISAHFAGSIYASYQPDGSSVETFWGENPSGAFTLGNPIVLREVHNAGHLNGGNPVYDLSAVKDYKTDVNGNVTQIDEYDWNLPGNVAHPPSLPSVDPLTAPAGTPVRTTKTVYAATVPATVYPRPGNYQTGAQEYWHATAFLLRAPTHVTVGHGTPFVADSDTIFSYDNALTTGNITGESRYNSETSGNAVISRTFGNRGDVLTETDPRNYQTKYEYNNANSPYPSDLYEAYGTAEVRHWTFTWDDYTGLRKTETDVDNGLTTQVVYDARGRVTEVSEGNGARVTDTEYKDFERTVTVTSPLDDPAIPQSCSQTCRKITTITSFDPLGRKWKTRNDSLNVEMMNLVALSGTNTYLLESNPYTGTTPSGESTMGWTRTKLDAAGRVVEVKHFTGSNLPTPWSGSDPQSTGAALTDYPQPTGLLARQTLTDPASKVREMRTDGLGRLAQVVEAGTNITIYSYDTEDRLTGVDQGGQTRSFTYSSLGRLLSANNPENGLTSYGYDGTGNVISKTDARGAQTTTAYDGLNRPTSRSYSNITPATPPVTYSYAGCGKKGPLCSVGNGISSTSFSYDNLMRIAGSTQTTPGAAGSPYSFTYQYKLNNALEKIGYPSGRSVSYAFNGGGQISQVAGTKSSVTTNYTSAGSPISYAPHGALLSMASGAGIVESRTYNSRLQPTKIEAGTMKLEFDYGTSNNGNVQWQKITRGGVVNQQNYAYDAFNRLDLATQTGASSWSEDYEYDRWGNRWVADYAGTLGEVPKTADWYTPLATPRPGQPPCTQPTCNRITSFDYDYAGNVTSVPGRTAVYDAENRQVSVTAGSDTTTYAYDADGRRIKKTTPTLIDGSLGQVTTIFVYDAMGQLAAEYGGPPVSDAGTRYLFQDHLGSTRLVTDGTTEKAYDYRPFGEEIGGSYPTGSLDVRGRQRLEFTGKERDAETGLDYFGARYMSAAQGRWTSPDKPFADQHPEDPQSWNLYGYVRNNPLKMIDDDGESATLIGGIVGGVVGGGVAWYQGKSIWKGALSGAAAGALAGSVIDTFGASGVAIAASGAAGGGAGYLLDTALNGGTATGTGLATSMAVGTGGALLGAGVGKVVQSLISADAALGGSIRNVNPMKGTSNCANCAIATDATLAGRPASAMPGGVTLTTALEQHFGSRFSSVSGQAAIDKSIGAAGNGARGIVFVREAGAKVGHFVNVVNQKGTIRYLDGQTGKAYNFSGNYDDVRLLRTN